MFYKIKQLCVCIAVMLFCTAAGAQTKYWVFFKDKPQASEIFDPYIYFHKNALERRILSGQSLYDFTDLPLNTEYISKLKKIADSTGNESRWFNALGIWATEEQVEKIAQLPFVRKVQQMTIKLQAAETNSSQAEGPVNDSELLQLQIDRMQGKRFGKNDITGAGVRIAVFDVGFKGVDTHPAFAHLRNRNKIILTQDFIKNDTFVYGFGTHGTMVLSCIAGIYQDSVPMGLATDANFLLARTERGLTEWKDEEDNWVAAMEWADKNGAQIISSSLGYTYKRYFYSDMDGETSLISKAANMAARKGMLVVTAAGNDGKSGWKYICTPADADSALTVGGTDPRKNYHIGFSSYGPAADETMKPNVCAPGQAFVANSREFTQAFGTSFATPLVAGFAACAWQINPKMSNMQLFKEIEKSASLHPYFDYAHGYGIPQAGHFLDKAGYGVDKNLLDNEKVSIDELVFQTFSISNGGNEINVNLENSFVDDSTSIARLADKKLYYHIADAQGKILKYYVIQPEQKTVLTLQKDKLPDGGTLRVHFEGYTQELKY